MVLGAVIVYWRKGVQFSLSREAQKDVLIKQLSKFTVHSFTGRCVLFLYHLMEVR